MPHSQEGICWSASPPHVSALHSSLARLAHFAEGALRLEAAGRHDIVSPGACGRRPSAQLAGAQARTRMGSWASAGPRTCQSRRCCRCGAARSVKLGVWSPCGGAGGCAGTEKGSAAGRGAPQELQVPRASLLHLPRASALYAFPPLTASYRATPTQQRRVALDGVWHRSRAGRQREGGAASAPRGRHVHLCGRTHSVALARPPGAYPCDADQGRTRRKAVRRAGRRASAPLTGAPPPHAAGGAALGGAEHRRRARGGRERRRRVLRLGPQRPRAAGRAGQRRGAARARAHRDPARLGRARDRVRVRPRP